MQIEEVSVGDSHTGQVHYFTAVLFRDWEFWTAGPSSHSRAQVLAELAIYRDVVRVQLVRTYVPYVN